MENRNFYKCIERMALKEPNKNLLLVDQDALTYGEFIETTKRYAKGLITLGIKENDKVGLFLPNCVEWYSIFWSVIYIGAQPVAFDPQSGDYETRRLFEATGVKACFIADKYRNNNIINVTQKAIDGLIPKENIILIKTKTPDITSSFVSRSNFEKLCSSQTYEKDVFEPDENHVINLACTSGTTGNPKVLTLPYHGFYDAILDMADYLEFNENDVMMLGMTLYHQGGFGMGLQMVVKNGTIIYQPQFNPVEFLKTIEKHKVTIIQLTSTLAKVLLTTPNFDQFDISSVKICYFAGEVLPKELAETFVEKLHIRVINIIGSSETATMVVWDSAKDYGTDPSDFEELPFTKVRVIKDNGEEALEGETGELCIYTSSVILNYHNNAEESAKKVVYHEGKRWFMTGDLVQRIENNRVRFVGRSKRIIKRGGNLVYAEEVESALLTYPRISAVAVVAKDHPVIGQQITAYIQSNDGNPVTRGEIAKFLAGKLSSYKLPDELILTEELPKDMGKVQFKYIRK